MVVAGSGGALDTLVRDQVEVTLSGMIDALVDNSSSQSVPILVLVFVCGEKPRNKIN